MFGPALATVWAHHLDDHITDLAWQPGGDLLLAGLGGGAVHGVDAHGFRRLADHPLGVLGVTWAPDGRVWASHGVEGGVHLVGIDGGRHHRDLQGWIGGFGWGAASAGPVAAVGSRCYRWSSWDAVPDLQLLAEPVQSLAWHPGGLALALGLRSGVRLEDGRGVHQRDLHATGPVLGLAWSPDGLLLAGSGHDDGLTLWDARDGTDRRLTGFPGRIHHRCWSRNGRWLVLACGNQAFALDTASGVGPTMEPLALPVHLGQIHALVALPQGGRIITAAGDGLLVVWDLHPSGAIPLGHLLLPLAIERVAVHADGQRIAVGTVDGVVEVVDLPGGD